MREGDGSPRFRSGMQPISRVSLGQIVGLLKAIEEAGGDADVAEIGRSVEMDLDGLGHIVDAAVFLGLARAEEGNLTIEDLGRKVLTASLRQRKAIVRDIIKDLPTFRRLTELLQRAGRPLKREEVLAAIAEHWGTHDAPSIFNSLIYWGRYVELLAYDSRLEEVSLRTPTPSAPPDPSTPC